MERFAACQLQQELFTLLSVTAQFSLSPALIVKTSAPGPQHSFTAIESSFHNPLISRKSSQIYTTHTTHTNHTTKTPLAGAYRIPTSLDVLAGLIVFTWLCSAWAKI